MSSVNDTVNYSQQIKAIIESIEEDLEGLAEIAKYIPDQMPAILFDLQQAAREISAIYAEVDY